MTALLTTETRIWDWVLDNETSKKHTPFWKEKQSEGSSVLEHHLSRLERKGPMERQCLLWFESDSEQLFLLGWADLEQAVAHQPCPPSCRCSQPCWLFLLPTGNLPQPKLHRNRHCKCHGLQKMAVLILLKNTQLRTGKLICSLQKISHRETFSDWMWPLVYTEFLT